MGVALYGDKVPIQRRVCEDRSCGRVESIGLTERLLQPHFCNACLKILEAIESTGEEAQGGLNDGN